MTHLDKPTSTSNNSSRSTVVVAMCREDQQQQNQRYRHDGSSSTKLAVHFRVGRLRFGFHGIVASIALVITCVAFISLLNAVEYAPWNYLVVWLSVIFNTITALQARQLLDQVPLQTEIVPGVVAPHRQAFKRTMSMMHYCNLRILGCILLETTSTIYSNILYKMFLAVFILKCFLPRFGSFDNGNTWIFVIPMFVGNSVDLIQYCLYPNLLGMHHYLVIEISALVIAFFFTLAFRGYVTVFQIYVVSATIVATLFGGGLYVITSSSMS